mmetsp:Transcript_37394/g.99388  ORF Transcript_37394/g.99388 Transcript_37394/m.99388 type:complete len:141 (-) Transcript_37394:41-463(-)
MGNQVSCGACAKLDHTKVDGEKGEADESAIRVDGQPVFDQENKAEEPESSCTYTVVFDKSRVSDLGLSVDHSASRCGLTVLAITGGLAAQWNAANPSENVAIGDEILEVNGTVGDVTQLLERCKRDPFLHMVLKRSGADA